eukprot:10660993-Alexandrium_andersonii.AAC.1
MASIAAVLNAARARLVAARAGARGPGQQGQKKTRAGARRDEARLTPSAWAEPASRSRLLAQTEGGA